MDLGQRAVKLFALELFGDMPLEGEAAFGGGAVQLAGFLQELYSLRANSRMTSVKQSRKKHQGWTNRINQT